VAVTAPKELRLQRLMARDGITRSYALSRIEAQPEDDYYRQNCGYVLENDGDELQFQRKCLAFFRQLGIMKKNLKEE
jgi:dephospho-CoA kinase